jgi:hypothetical protein
VANEVGSSHAKVSERIEWAAASKVGFLPSVNEGVRSTKLTTLGLRFFEPEPLKEALLNLVVVYVLDFGKSP